MEEIRNNFIHDIIDADLADNPELKIHTRFPPEPNGYLHIGSAKAIWINAMTAKKYGGLFNLRYDDTNPSKEDNEYVESIYRDLTWLGCEPTGGVFYGSDYFDKCYEYAVKLIKEGKAVRIKQDDSLSNYAAKIEKADCLIDFSKPAKAVHDQIRGLSPIPLSFTHTSDEKLLKVLEARVNMREGVCGKAGEVVSLDGGIEVACGEGSVLLLRVLPEGKGRMAAADFVRGRKVSLGDILN